METKPAYRYLHQCRALHSQVRGVRYGSTSDLTEIENRVKAIRSSGQFTYADLEHILDPNIWKPEQFGYWPSREEIESSLDDQTWDFWNLPKKQDEAIAKLLKVFRQIELVSVILRFIVPEHFGILSPPVEKIIGLSPFRQRRKRYAHYLEDLRKIRDKCGFNTVADAEMALWVLQLGILEGRLKDHLGHLGDRELADLRDEYRRDPLLRTIRVKNLTAELFNDLSRPELAEALVETNSDLAAQIAGMEFECSIHRLAKQEGLTYNTPEGKQPSLHDLVDRLGQRRPYSDHLAEFRLANKLRNDAVHPRDKPLVPHMARKLVAALERTLRLEKPGQHKG